jgi:multimeric flavodoxin WrbA
LSIHVLGVAASPRSGATTRLVRACLKGAETVEGTTTEYVSLAGKRISACDGCLSCLNAPTCHIDDDMQALYPAMLRADAIVLGTPVYYGSPCALAKSFMERVTGLGGIREKKLRLKIGGAIAAGGSRNGGQETTLQALHLWFHINDMLPIGITAPVTQWGVTSSGGLGEDDVESDIFELKMSGRQVPALGIAWMYGRKIATVTQIVNAGRQATGFDLPDSPYGYELPESFPADVLHFADQ